MNKDEFLKLPSGDVYHCAVAVQQYIAELKEELALANESLTAAYLAGAASKNDEVREMAKKGDVDTQIGAGTNPRYLLWLICQWDNVGPIYEYTLWIDRRWSEWCTQTKRPRWAHTKDDHAEFDAWLMRWVRREIVKTSAFGEIGENAALTGAEGVRVEGTVMQHDNERN